jgi:hypothetical protein
MGGEGGAGDLILCVVLNFGGNHEEIFKKQQRG